MYAGCFSILIIIGAIVIIFMRSNRANYSLATLPLGVVPLFHLIAFPLAKQLAKAVPLEETYLMILFDLVGLAVAEALFGFFGSSIIGARKSRQIYLGCCSLFSILLTAILVHSILTAAPVG